MYIWYQLDYLYPVGVETCIFGICCIICIQCALKHVYLVSVGLFVSSMTRNMDIWYQLDYLYPVGVERVVGILLTLHNIQVSEKVSIILQQ